MTAPIPKLSGAAADAAERAGEVFEVDIPALTVKDQIAHVDSLIKNLKNLREGMPEEFCSENLALQREIRKSLVRYDVVRHMNVSQLRDAWQLNISTGKPFDQIIDELAPFFGISQEK